MITVTDLAAEKLAEILAEEGQPEAALRAANTKFTARFQQVEAALADSGRNAADIGLAELDRLWEEAKQAERKSPPPGAATTDPPQKE